MKKNLTIRTFLLLAAMILGARAGMYAQTPSMANYGPPARTTGIVYNSIEFSGDAIYSWRNAGTSTEDDNRSYPVPIGFDFYYLGQRYTSMSVSTNGFIDFSSSTRDGGPGIDTRAYWAFGPYDQDLSSSTRSAPSGDAGTFLAIAPFYYDLTTQGEVDPLGGSIKYIVTGTAPNRVLTIEWIRMAIWTNTTPNFNFQLKLYESSGKIEFVYSTMVQGTFDWAASPTNGYTVGMSGPTIGNPPTASQVLIQQTANTTTFSATQQNDLRTVPTSNSMLTFTPPVPTAPTALSFTAVTTTGMTLNWTDNASNEVGYVIYRSDDGGSTYDFVRSLAANAVTSAETNLVPGITYYWRVYAVTEGALSTPLSGTRATNAPTQYISTRTGNWNTNNTWVGNSVPPAFSNVIINNGHTVTINTNVQVSNLTVGQGTSGTLVIGDNTTARSVAIVGNLDIQAGATFAANASNNATHTMTLSGNLTNAGTFEMAPTTTRVCNVTFNKGGSQSVSGSGAATHFNLITLNMGASKNNILDVFATNFAAPNNFLTLINGTFNLATAATLTPFTATDTIPINAGLRINNSSAVVNTTGGILDVNGDLYVTAGTLNVGNAVNNHLVSYGGRFVFNGGTVNIAGGFIPKDNYTITDLTLSDGTVTINTLGSNNTAYAPFTILVSGSKFNQSGGTIVLQQKGTATGVDSLGYTNFFYSIYTVSGGTLQLGNASTPASQIMNIKSSIPVNNIKIFNSNVTAVLKSFPLTVYGNVDNAGGILHANGLDMTVKGTWTNTGTFAPTTAKVTFNGSSSQSITRAAGETFNKLAIATSGSTVSLLSNAAVADTFALSSGTLAVGTNTLTLNGTVTGSGVLTSGTTGTVSYNKSTDVQNILRANYGNLSFSAYTKTLPATDTVGVAGTFTSGRAGGHTVTGSTVSFNGSGAQLVPVFNFNNLSLVTGGTKTFSAGTDTVFGDLKTVAGVTMADGGASVVVFKNIVHNGIHSGTGNITLAGGAVAHAISGTGTFTNLTVNDPLGATFASDLVIKGALTLAAGVMTPMVATNKVVIDVTGTLARTTGWVNGTMQRYAPGGTSTLAFTVGDATRYAPATIAFGTVATPGTITANTTSSDHPQVAGSSIDPTNSVNRYWTVTNGGIVFDTCNVILQWVTPGDQDVTGSEGLYIVGRYAGGVWDTTTSDTKTSTSIRGVGVRAFGDFIVGFNGNANAYRTKGGGTGTGNWTSTIWQYYNTQIATWRDTTAYPIATNAGLITIQAGDVVTIPVGILIDQAIVQSGAKLIVASGQTLTIRDGTGTDLTVGGTLRNAGNDIVVNSGATIAFVNGSSYEHAIAGGNIPVATWSATSTCEVQGATGAAPGNLNQAFGNFIWNCTGQTADIILANTPSAVAGRYTVAATGTKSLQLFSSGTNQTSAVGGSFAVVGGTVNGISATGTDNAKISVGDSLVVTGGLFALSTNNGDRLDIDVAGNVKISGGTLRLSASSSTNIVTVVKNFSHTAGTMDQSGSGRGRMVFGGTTPQLYASGGTVTGNVDYVVNSGATLVLGTSILTGAGAFTLQNSGTISLGSAQGITASGAAGNVQASGTRSFGTGANYIYNSLLAQQTGNGLPATVNKLVINDTLGVTLTGSVIVTDSLQLLSGVFGIGGNTLTLNNITTLTSGSLQSGTTGLVFYNGSSAGQPVIQAAYGNLQFSNYQKVLPATEMTIAGSFTPGSGTGHTVTGNTVNYNGAAQTIVAFPYNNLKTGGSGVKTLSSYGSTCVVNGNLLLLAGSFVDSGYTITVKGNIVNNVTHTGAGKVYVTGAATPHALSGSGSYTNMELNDANGIVLTGNLNMNGVLTLTSGVITTGTDSLLIGTAGSIERASNSLLRHVFGIVRKPIPVNASPQTVLFETGDATRYAPVSVTFNAVSTAGTLAAKSVTGDHPNINGSGIDPLKSVNRSWTINNKSVVFTTYSVTLNFDATDIDAGANTAYFFVKRYAASAWTTPTVISRGSTNIRVDGLSLFGDFAVGELTTTFYWSGLAGNHLWTDVNNWNLLNTPTTANDVILNGTDTVDVNTAAVCKNITIGNVSLMMTILPTRSLSASGNLTMTDGQLNTQNAFPAVTGTLTLNGGTVGYTSTGVQSVPVFAYYGLAVGGGSTKTAAGTIIVSQNLTIAPGTTFADAGYMITVKGSANNSGVHSGTGKISLASGSAPHQLSGSGTYKNLELNDANGATVVNGPSVNGVLTLTNGILTATADTVDIVSPGSVSRANGYVLGNLQKFVNTTGTVALTYEMGSATTYLPVTVTLTGVSGAGGSVTVGSNAGDHPDVTHSSLKSDSSAHRYWTISNNGITIASFTPTFRWASSELNSAITYTTDFIIANKPFTIPALWTEVTAGSPTLTSIQGVSLTTFGSFQAGKPDTMTFTSIVNGNWNAPATWDKNRVPQPRDRVLIVTPYSVTLTDARSINHFAIDNGGTFNNNNQTLTVSKSILLSGTWSGLGTILWPTTTSDIFYGTNGTTSSTAVLQITGNNKTFNTTNTAVYQIDLASAATVTNAGSLTATRVTGAAAGSTLTNNAGATLNIVQDLLNTGTLTATASNNTVTYAGTGSQPLKATNYFNLGISGTRTGSNSVTFPSGSTIGIAGAFTPTATFGTGGYVITNSTVDYNGTGAQTVAGFNYNNLTISGSRTTNTVTLASSPSIGVAGTFAPSATFSTGSYASTGSTIDINGSGAQAVPVFVYHNLNLSTGGTKTASGALSVWGNLAINTGATFATGATIDTIYGNWTTTGTFTASTSCIVFGGSPASTITGTTTFAALEVNKNSSITNVTLTSSVTAANLAMTKGAMQTGSNSITITANRTGNGLIIGTIIHTHTFTSGTQYAFEGPNNFITFNVGGTLPTSVTETVVLSSPGANTYMDPINRYYTIAMTGGSGYTFAYRLHYEDAEVVSPNSETIPTLKFWRETSPGVWDRKGVSSNDVTNNWVYYDTLAATETGKWCLSSRTVPLLVLTLAQSNDHPSPNDVVVYTITWNNTGDGNATNALLTASAPSNTTYNTGSVYYNSVLKTDANDGDGVTVVGSNITININTLIGNLPIPPYSVDPTKGFGTITYSVTIN